MSASGSGARGSGAAARAGAPARSPFSLDDDGAYAIEGLAPGEYTLEPWHEKLGKKRKTVKC